MGGCGPQRGPLGLVAERGVSPSVWRGSLVDDCSESREAADDLQGHVWQGRLALLARWGQELVYLGLQSYQAVLQVGQVLLRLVAWLGGLVVGAVLTPQEPVQMLLQPLEQVPRTDASDGHLARSNAAPVREFHRLVCSPWVSTLHMCINSLRSSSLVATMNSSLEAPLMNAGSRTCSHCRTRTGLPGQVFAATGVQADGAPHIVW